MQTRNLSPLLLLFAAIFTIAAAPDSLARERYVSAPPGRIVITCSPVLAFNIGIPIMIDGRPAGVLTKGHTFREYLPPGRHVITVSRNGRPRETTDTIVDVRPGETYPLTAKYRVNEVILVAP